MAVGAEARVVVGVGVIETCMPLIVVALILASVKVRVKDAPLASVT
jgi:hypothetical protein